MGEPQDTKNSVVREKSASKPHNADTAVDLEKHPHAHGIGEVIEPFMAVSHKKKLIAAVVTILIVVAVAVAALWYFMAGPGSMGEQSGSEGTDVTAAAPYQEHVAAAFGDIKGEAAQIVSVTSLGGQTDEGTLLYDFAPYQVEGTSFKSLPASGEGTALRVADAGNATSALQLAHELLTSQGGMTRMSESVKDAGGLVSQNRATVSSYATYRSNDTICSLAYLTGSGAHVVSVGCAAISEYKKAADTAKPFVEAFKAANASTDTAKMIFSAPDVTNGADGVRGATLYQRVLDKNDTSGVYVYYNPAKDSKASWQLLGGAYTSSIPCQAFKTSEQKAAFATRTCYDESQKRERAI